MNTLRNRAGFALREAGQALERLGCVWQGVNSHAEELTRLHPVVNAGHKVPQVAATTWIAPSAQVSGDVRVGDNTSIWYNCSVRGDNHAVEIGHGTNLQDGAAVGSLSPGSSSTWVGSFVSVGHGAVLQGCTVGDKCLIGMNAVVQDGCTVESGAMLAAGSVLPAGATVPTGELWAGNPARKLRELKAEETAYLESLPQRCDVAAARRAAVRVLAARAAAVAAATARPAPPLDAPPQGASAEIYLHGAHVTSWKDPSGKDILFTSSRAIFKPPKAIRGGVPVCFPQFGQLGPLGQHGFARNSRFELAAESGAAATLVRAARPRRPAPCAAQPSPTPDQRPAGMHARAPRQVLKASGSEDPKYPHPFELSVRVELGDGSLTQELSVTNTGGAAMAFTAALHTYFAVPDITSVVVEGLDGVAFTDSLAGGARHTQAGPVGFDREVDRIYLAAPDGAMRVVDRGSGAVVEVHKTAFPDAVVWNPWVDKAAAMADFGDDEYKARRRGRSWQRRAAGGSSGARAAAPAHPADEQLIPASAEQLLASCRVVLVAPKTAANVGAVARACANFECTDLVVVAPRCDPLAGEAWKVACGEAVLGRLRVVDGLADALADTTGSLGFTRRAGATRFTHASVGELLQKFPSAIAALDPAAAAAGAGRTALVFGREESGLTEAELRLCSHSCAIPTGRIQGSMNLSHAAAVVLAGVFERRLALLGLSGLGFDTTGAAGSADAREGLQPASAAELGALLAKASAIAEAVGLSGDESRGGGAQGSHGRRRLPVGHVRAILSRAAASTWEVRSLHGLASAVLKRVGGGDGGSAAAAMDGKYFSTTKKGEIHELKEELASLDRYKKKEAVKKVIAAMTVGKDVSMLFPAVVNCMQTDDLELKKLVYLYLINYAKTQPDLAIMAVNTFVKDSQEPNPLIRALAVRTMGCIRVDKITEYLCDPLQRCLKDDDPYVRKTAAVCVAKLFDINPELVEDRGFLDMLREMLSDANPMVVANALAALQEIQEVSGKEVLTITPHTLFKLLAALNECTEWGQVFILDALVNYTITDSKDAEKIVERVLPRLQHVNSAVVLSAAKVVLRMMEEVSNEELIRAWSRKLAPPLVTLLSAEPEVQYVALRNISLIVQRWPHILAHEVKVFFCKYNDPIYVKMEKLEIMIQLASDKNIDQVLLEFKEYAQEVDVDFVRKAVRAIGRCAVSLEAAAQRCIAVLLELIATKVNYVVQEAVIVIKRARTLCTARRRRRAPSRPPARPPDIFRRYPNQYESIIAQLCDSLDALDEPEAKASMVWIIGEYAERIDNADELLETFLETFPEETSMVQLQLLTATVKLFLKKPTEGVQRMIQLVLSAATNETDNPDLRDRAYVYWRLLSTDPEAAKDVVLASKPVITDDAATLDPALLRSLMHQIASLASVFHKPADTFVSRQRLAVASVDALAAGGAGAGAALVEAGLDDDGGGGGGAAAVGGAPAAPPAPAASSAPVVDLLGDDLLGGPAPPAPAPAAGAATPGGLDDLLGGLDIAPAAAAAAPAAAAAAAPPAAAAAAAADPFDMFGAPPAPAAAAPPAPGALPAGLPLLLGGEKGKGLSVAGQLRRAGGGGLVYDLAISNGSAGPVGGFMLQVNSNSFGVAPADQVVAVGPLAPGGVGRAAVPLAFNPAKLAPPPASTRLQVALRSDQLGVLYWDDAVPLPAVLEEGGAIDGQAFLAAWRALPETPAQRLDVTVADGDAAKAALAAVRVFVLAQRPVPGTGQDALYATARVHGGAQVLLELRLTRGVPGMDAWFRSERAELRELVLGAVRAALAA
ncbi:BETAC-AD [Scenedesmus sp. PABB004]|nr:BETAC-AD [Scenedesmus sp. PABB004]